MSKCFQCPANTYSGSGASICTACEAGKTSTAGSSACVSAGCAPGTYVSGGGCTNCPPGSYSTTTSASACTGCSAGTYSGVTGASSPTVCTNCLAGTYSSVVGASSSTVCTSCVAGKYSSIAGATSSTVCTNCPAGSYAAVAGTSACVSCPINTFSGAGVSSCQSCQANALSVAGSESQEYCYCKSGYAHAAGAYTCRICDPGTWNSQLGRTACSNCSVGLYSEHYGAVGNETCLSCPLGQWSPEGSPNCNLCPVNSFAGAGSGSQTNCNCNAGYTGPNGGLCSACAAGQYKNATGAATCVSCPVGSTSPNASSSVSNCTCSPGYVNVADVCTAVITRAVRISGTLTTVTTDSSPGDIAAAMSQFRYQIAAMLGIPVGLVQIERTYLNSGRALLSTEITIVLTISARSTTELNTLAAATADLSTIAGLSGASQTIVEGTTPLSNLTCSACPANSYYAQGQCVSCMNNTVSVPGSLTCQCEAGFTGTAGACQACPAGTYKRMAGTSACRSCQPNSRSDAASVLCSCDPGYTAKTGDVCVACVAGKYKNTTGSAECTSCAGNRNSIPASTNVTACVCNIGYTQVENEALTYDVVYSQSCVACDIGKFKPLIGVQACTACGMNQSAVPASPICSCIPGFTGPDGGPCSECALGKYKDWLGSQVCTTCPANSYVPGIGSTLLSNCTCNFGYTGPDGGPCPACVGGKYKNVTGTSACISCSANFYSNLDSAATTCVTCPSNSISPTASVFAGCACVEGYTGLTSISTPCTACVSGTYKSIIGTSSCLKCPANTYHNVTAVSSVTGCQGCPANSISFSGESICYCDRGSTGPDGGPCVNCEAGKYKNWRNSSACPVCHENADSTEGFALCKCNAGYTGAGKTGAISSGSDFIDLLQTCGSSENEMCKSLGCGNDAALGGGCLNSQFNDNDYNTRGGIPCGWDCRPSGWTVSALPIDFVIEKTVTSVVVYWRLGDCYSHFCGPLYTVRVGNTFPGLYPETSNELLCPPSTPDYGLTPRVTINGVVFTKFTIDCGNTLRGRYFTINKQNVAWSSSTMSVTELQVIGFKEYTACAACVPGKYKNKTLSNDVCTSCPSNSYEPDIAAVTVTNCTCNTGFDGADGGPCTGCALGKYKNNNDTTPCVECPVDTYIDVQSSAYCKACPEFTTSPSGSTSIASCICKLGYTGGGGAVTVGVPSSNLGRSCGVNYNEVCLSSQSTTRGSQPSSAALDTILDTISHTEAGGDQWFRIDFGRAVYVQSVAIVILRAHEVDYHRNIQVRVGNVDAYSSNPTCYVHSGSLTTLGGGTSYWARELACTTPREGRYLYYVNPDGLNYVTFAEFSPKGFLNAPKVACSACAIGKYKDVIGSAMCTSCPSSTFSGANNATSIETCTSCPGNSTSLLGSASKDYCQCNVGFIHEGAGCAACLPGTFNPRLAQIACSNCTVGTYSLNYGAVSNETCASCKETEYSPEGSALCQPCPPNSVAAAGSSKIQDCGCTYGYTGASASLCEKCAQGKFKNITGNWLCQSCSVNSYSLSGATALTACFCDPGYTGAYGPFCVACALGKYKSIYGSSACIDCPVNTYADRTGMTVCTSCVNTSASAVASFSIWNCTCNAGYKGPTYEDVVAHDNFARSCGDMRNSPCTATQSSTLTTQVAEGIFEFMNPAQLANDNSSSTFSTTAFGTNQWWRVDFERRVTVNSVSLLFSRFAIDMLHVHVGDVNSSIGNLMCASIAVNSSSTDWTTTTCASSLTGRYLYVRNSIASQVTLQEVQVQGTEVLVKIWPDWCEKCPVGTYKTVTGNLPCDACPSNRFSTSLAATSISTCLSCPANSVSVTGSDQCACDLGFSGPANACIACASATFKTDVGSASCATCPANSVIAANASTAAMPCTCLSGFEPR